MQASAVPIVQPGGASVTATAAVAPVAGWQQGRGAACAHLVLLLSLLLQEETSVPCECNEYIGELLRGVRQHLST